ncbi:MAG: glycine-rich domain-containing protein [Candidatus Microsaccharimonas sp.]
MFKGINVKGGFALPTVLIASVVMLTVLAVSVTSVTAVRTSLKAQYYEQLAKVAGEAGVAYAKACLAKNGNVPLWTDAKPLTPATDCAGNLLLTPAVQAIIVAGGGGGGGGIGGGGGGGGVIQDDSIAISTGLRIVTVGAGGAGGAGGATGGTGGNSSLNGIGLTALGGGGGGGRNGSSPTAAGDGGSGGGGNGSYVAATGSGALGGIGEADQGNDGGNGSAGNSGSLAGNGGGGGGAGAPGGNASGTASGDGISGDGGNGILSDISGTQVSYGAGGAGGRWGDGELGIPGITGGGDGGAGTGVVGGAGQANTGAGGGGGSSGNAAGGAGGSGVVVLRYANNGTITATGGTVSISGPYKIHRFASSSTFNVSAVSTSSCPSDPRCSVTVNGNVRSSFKVPRPKLDIEGRASTIPNTGYVELLRESTGQVWRTYKQPTVQSAVVPDLCDSGASTALGWDNAAIAGVQSSLPGAPAARSISLSNDDLNAGQMYFKKDFVLTETTTLQISLHTASSADYAELYINGSRRAVAQGAVGSGSITLPVGCHTVNVRLTNKTLMPRKSQFTASLQRTGAAPLVVTNTSWRASAGSAVHYSDSDFYADPTIWKNATDLQNASLSVATWPATTGDSQAHLITASCNTSCPANSSTYFRDGKSFVLTSSREVLVSALCDDDCAVYIDGNLVISSSPWSNVNQQTLTLTAGVHHVSARLYNGNAGAAKLAVALYDRGNGDVLSRTDTSWLTSNNQWVTGTNAGNDPFSYEDSFEPSPSVAPAAVTYDVVVVAGGGGGAGNCNTCGGAGGGGGGGVIFREKQTASNGTYTVTVGTGGSAGAGGASRTNGGSGNDSVFNTLTAIGGGGGGTQLGNPGLAGGSGGGGSGGGTPAPGAGGNGTSGQGSRGGNGGDGTLNNNGGGGGGATGTGMPGTQPAAGDGGPGLISYLTGTRKVYGSGGGGGAYGTYQNGLAGDGAGNGANQSINAGVGYSGLANTGGGGGGGNGLTLGKNGGAGGSGVVVFRIKTGTKTVTLGGTGARSSTTVTIKGISYTVYTFTSGTSTITLS